MFLIALLYILFASTFTFSKAALEYASPIFLIAIRFLVAGGILCAYQWFRGNSLKIKKVDWPLCAQLIFFTYYLSFATDNWALQYISSSKACLIYNLSPFVTAALSYFLFKSKITFRQAIGLTIGFLGFMPILFDQYYNGDTTNVIGFISVAEGVLLVSVISAAYGWLVMKQLINRGYSIVTINGVGLLGAGIIAIVHSLLTEGWPVIQARGGYDIVPLRNMVTALVPFGYTNVVMFSIYLILLVLIAHIICYILYGYLLRYYSATFLSFAGFTTPLFAAILGWLLLGERISWYFILTLVIVSYGLYIFYQDEKW